MSIRSTQIQRKTGETDIHLTLNLDGCGRSEIDSGCGFLDHMLTLFARHGRFDLTLSCAGDVQVDDHHTVEDIALCLGEAFAACLGEKRGITRYGDITLPMDEALILCAVDLSGRGVLGYALDIPTEKVGTFDTQLCEEFFTAFAREGRMTLHLRQLAGKNSHHIIEGAFKAAARALRAAVAVDPEAEDEIPSTKGIL